MTGGNKGGEFRRGGRGDRVSLLLQLVEMVLMLWMSIIGLNSFGDRSEQLGTGVECCRPLSLLSFDPS